LLSKKKCYTNKIYKVYWVDDAQNFCKFHPPKKKIDNEKPMYKKERAKYFKVSFLL
jgi:hypothetical protein